MIKMCVRIESHCSSHKKNRQERQKDEDENGKSDETSKGKARGKKELCCT